MSATSSPSAFTQHLTHQYDLPRAMIDRMAADFSSEEATREAGGQKSLVWYLGHIAITDNYFLTLYGDSASALPKEFVDRFGRGSHGHEDFTGTSKDEVVSLLATLADRVRAVIATLAPEDLARATEQADVHPRFKTLGSALALIVAHAGYHAGQIGDLRRELGKEALFG